MISKKWKEILTHFVLLFPIILVIFFTFKSCDKKECAKHCLDFKNVEKQFWCIDQCNK